jgi:hypothetical protein
MAPGPIWTLDEGRYIALAFLTPLLCGDVYSALLVGRIIPLGRATLLMDREFLWLQGLY